MATIDEIKQQAEAVKNAMQVGENTAMRVGGALAGLADVAKEQEDNIRKKADKDSIVQESGDAEDKVMSQKATTIAIADETTRAKAAEKAIIFDVSVYNNGEVFESLQALLGSSNLDTLIPVSFRHGGMTIRFIQGSEQSSDNKYVQYRLMADSFSITVANWQGVDDEPTAGSDNLVKSGGVANKLSELENNKIDKDADIISKKDAFYITDGKGNVIAKIDSIGVSSTDFNVKVGGELISILSLINDKVSKDGNKGLSEEDFTTELKEKLESMEIKSDYPDALYVTDAKGFVFLSIAKDENGKYKFNYAGQTKEVLPLEGYELFSIGDSLSAGGVWQSKVAELTGCTFRQDVNAKPGMNLSTGGTNMMGGAVDSGFFRAKNLVDQNVISDNGKKAIIILENVNDRGQYGSGTMNDSVMIPHTPIDLNSRTLTESVLSSVENSKRTLDACVTLIKDAVGKKITINSLPSKEGDVTISTGSDIVGKQSYNIHVTPSDTLSTIVAKILEYSYTGVTDIDGGDGKSVIFSCGIPDRETYLEYSDISGTGMQCAITSGVEAQTRTTMFFSGSSIEEWTDVSKWKNGGILTYHRAWKSVIQYLVQNFPLAHVIVAGFPGHIVTKSDYALANGSYDQVAMYNSTNENNVRLHNKELEAIANYYCIPYIEINNECGINIENITEYYNEKANIHPKQSGYMLFAEVISRKLFNLIK